MRARIESSRRSRGFTLIEAAIVTAIVGFAIVGMLQLIAAGSMANAQSTELTTAMGLASNIHEMSENVPFSQAFSTFKGYTRMPPVDAKGNAISDLVNWEQIVDVKYVDPNNITVTVPDTQTEPCARVYVTITHYNRLVFTTSWLIGDGTGS